MIQWFALQVQSKLAKVASATLRGKGYEEFLPLCRTLPRSNRIRAVETPLFPGYLFCRFDPSDRILPILTTPGVMRIVSLGRTPVPVTEDEIEAIRMVTRSGLPAEPCTFPGVGCKAVIERGPLAGLEGVVTEVSGARRLVVSVTMLRRSVAVDIDRSWVGCSAPVARCIPQFQGA